MKELRPCSVVLKRLSLPDPFIRALLKKINKSRKSSSHSDPDLNPSPTKHIKLSHHSLPQPTVSPIQNEFTNPDIQYKHQEPYFNISSEPIPKIPSIQNVFSVHSIPSLDFESSPMNHIEPISKEPSNQNVFFEHTVQSQDLEPSPMNPIESISKEPSNQNVFSEHTVQSQDLEPSPMNPIESISKEPSNQNVFSEHTIQSQDLEPSPMNPIESISKESLVQIKLFDPPIHFEDQESSQINLPEPISTSSSVQIEFFDSSIHFIEPISTIPSIQCPDSVISNKIPYPSKSYLTEFTEPSNQAECPMTNPTACMSVSEQTYAAKKYDEETGILKCIKCQFSTLHPGALAKHMKMIHGIRWTDICKNYSAEYLGDDPKKLCYFCYKFVLNISHHQKKCCLAVKRKEMSLERLKYSQKFGIPQTKTLLSLDQFFEILNESYCNQKYSLKTRNLCLLYGRKAIKYQIRKDSQFVPSSWFDNMDHFTPLNLELFDEFLISFSLGKKLHYVRALKAMMSSIQLILSNDNPVKCMKYMKEVDNMERGLDVRAKDLFKIHQQSLVNKRRKTDLNRL